MSTKIHHIQLVELCSKVRKCLQDFSRKLDWKRRTDFLATKIIKSSQQDFVSPHYGGEARKFVRNPSRKLDWKRKTDYLATKISRYNQLRLSFLGSQKKLNLFNTTHHHKKYPPMNFCDIRRIYTRYTTWCATVRM